MSYIKIDVSSLRIADIIISTTNIQPSGVIRHGSKSDRG